jgi:hypothetical protein
MIEDGKRIFLTKSERFDILKRDGFRCVYCGITSADTQLEIDHIVPIGKNGSTKTENLAAACNLCNRGKGLKILIETKPKAITERNNLELSFKRAFRMQKSEIFTIAAVAERVGKKEDSLRRFINTRAKAGLTPIIETFMFINIQKNCWIAYEWEKFNVKLIQAAIKNQT